MSPRPITPPPAPAFHSYFEIFSGHGEVDARSLESVLLLVGISLTPAQVEEALTSADVDGEWGRLHGNARPIELHGALSVKGPALGLMLCCRSLEILFKIFYLFLERGRQGEKRETSIRYLSHTPT